MELVTNAVISDAAYALLNYCVLNDSPQKKGHSLGGVIKGVGTSLDDYNIICLYGIICIFMFPILCCQPATSTDHRPLALLMKPIRVATDLSIPYRCFYLLVRSGIAFHASIPCYSVFFQGYIKKKKKAYDCRPDRWSPHIYENLPPKSHVPRSHPRLGFERLLSTSGPCAGQHPFQIIHQDTDQDRPNTGSNVRFEVQNAYVHLLIPTSVVNSRRSLA